MDQSIDKILLVCNVDGSDLSEVNGVIDREKVNGFLCVSQNIVSIPNTSPVQYTLSLGFSKIENTGNVGG